MEIAVPDRIIKVEQKPFGRRIYVYASGRRVIYDHPNTLANRRGRGAAAASD